jgi:hypothetical protein
MCPEFEMTCSSYRPNVCCSVTVVKNLFTFVEFHPAPQLILILLLVLKSSEKQNGLQLYHACTHFSCFVIGEFTVPHDELTSVVRFS